MDAAFLAAAPKLRAVFYGAGSVRGMVTDALWERGLVVTSSWGANGIPVAEYTLSQILFSLKLGWRYALSIRRDGAYPRRWPVPGAYGSTVAIVSLGMIGRLVCKLLRPFDIKVVAYDPFASPQDAAALGVTQCSLDECFARADVVSLHTPWLPETERMITGAHFRAMKQDATFINTARGAVVDEPAMVEVLRQRPDLTAILDVTHPEPPKPGSPLYTLPNVVLTPHIAGSMDTECRRMGRYAVEECRRFLAGEPLQWRVTRERAATLA
jgi:phosphoglycerate dehydrogenase-like enzyme